MPSGRGNVIALRRYVFELRESTAPSVGLDEKVQALVARMGSAYPSKVELSVESMDSYHSDDELILLLTEALSNALRHSEANHVTVEVALEDTDIAMVVEDDGTGFDPSEIGPGMGLANMRTRVLGLDGEMDVDSEPDRGTRVSARIPIRSLHRLS